MELSEEVKKEIMKTFKAELDDHLGTLNKDLLAIEENPSRDDREHLMEEILRAAHSLKGAARAVGLSDIVSIVDKLEDCLSAINQGKLTPVAEVFDVIFPSLDMMKQAMKAHLQDKSLPEEERDRLLDDMRSILEQREPSVTGTASVAEPETAPEVAPVSEPEPDPEPEPEQEAAKDPEPEPEIPQSAPVRSAGPTGQAIRNPHSTDDTIRVATAKLDTLMDGMGELLVARMSSEQHLEELKTLQQQLIRWQKSWRTVRTYFNAVQRQKEQVSDTTAPLLDFLDDNAEHLTSLGEKINSLVSSGDRDHAQLSILTDDLQDRVRGVRMLPVMTLFDIFPRMVRDLARDMRKEITLQIEGGESELDRHIMEAIKDPLTHLLRNAVDHGIETPEQREVTGKPRKGTIVLRAAQKDNSIVLKVSDDGAGIDVDALKKKAVEHNFLRAQDTAALSDQESIGLIFHSGLSTQAQATDISGRGVGLDVVRQNLELLHGLVQTDSIAGHGTTFTLTLPLTLVTNQVLLLEISDQIMAVPVTSVERIQRVAISDIGSIKGGATISVNGKPLPLTYLARALGLNGTKKTAPLDETIPVVILGAAEKRAAFQVDGFQGIQEVVIKSMGQQLRQVQNVAGACTLGSGQVIMILNTTNLMKFTHTGPAVAAHIPAEEHETGVHKILVVDDSITTRTLEKNILENAGYQVSVAADGEEAWALIQSEPLDVIVADVDMPRMDGFTLTENVKTDERYKEIPVVLVTSWDDKQHKIRGMEVGANAYITKQTFEQQDLLETIEKLIG